MADGKEIVTLSEIRKRIRKDSIIVSIVFVIFWALLFLESNALYAASKMLLFRIFNVCFIITGLGGLAECIYTIIKSGRPDFFTIRTDTLIEKREHVRIGYRQNGNRLRFMQGHFDIFNKAMDPYVEPAPYYISMKAVWDTAFIGDSFTLIERKHFFRKTILYAFNNKLYEIIDD